MSQDVSTNAALSKPSETTLRIATYNIHKGVSAWSRRNRIHDLRLGLHKLEADIVFLQEVQGRSDRHAQRFDNWPEAAQHDFLAGDQWTQATYGRNSVRSDGDHGNALLSRYPLLMHENLDVSDHAYESRGLLHCELEIMGRRVHCLCAHLGLFEGSRQRQVTAMIARIREHVPPDAPLIIAGDFNDWRVRSGRQLIEQLGVREVFDRDVQSDRDPPQSVGFRWRMPKSLPFGQRHWLHGHAQPARTFPSAFPLLRLDRVYVRGFSVSKATVMHGAGWNKLSDHAPIVVDLAFADQATA